MGQLDKKQLNIFAKALMPVLYEIQARFNNWEKAIKCSRGKQKEKG